MCRDRDASETFRLFTHLSVSLLVVVESASLQEEAARFTPWFECKQMPVKDDWNFTLCWRSHIAVCPKITSHKLIEKRGHSASTLQTQNNSQGWFACASKSTDPSSVSCPVWIDRSHKNRSWIGTPALIHFVKPPVPRLILLHHNKWQVILFYYFLKTVVYPSSSRLSPLLYSPIPLSLPLLFSPFLLYINLAIFRLASLLWTPFIPQL